ncbi:hypothetical protein CVT24_002824 [Panaeolus cyanescens]|uniref:DUF6593 domain-containing protein n=1 Tax=Panaeolus cyanescens TaxID=181874 RepID=A0A409YRH5_9AGAR|nr:hypothetical protein CVT24_002824 [Panaeolus cyanescens]
MLLYLSSEKPWNTIYTNDSGQALFKCEASSANTLSTRTFTLYRTLAPSELGWQGGEGQGFSAAGEDERFLKDEFEMVGQVVYDVWSSDKSVIKIGKDPFVEGTSARDMFSKSGWGFYGRNRSFTAPDGSQYTWKLGASSCSLYPMGTGYLKHVEPILKFKQATMGIFSKPRPASLEIKGGYEDNLHMLLLTFIYMEKVRIERESTLEEAGTI